MAIALHDPSVAPVDQYAAALQALNAAHQSPTPDQILAVLMARDRVQQDGETAQTLSQKSMLTLITLDQQLRSLAGPIVRTVKLSDWRDSINPPKTAWWWFLEAPEHQLDRFDWLWSALTVASLTGSASLVVDIGSRFLTGGPGLFGSFAVLSQGIITLATAGGVLTDAGRRMIDQMLCSVGIRRYYWQETKFGLSLLLLLTLVGSRASLPVLSQRLTQHGRQNLEEGQLSDAKSGLERAISLNASNLEAHYALGSVLESFQRRTEAEEQYHIALKGGYLPAYNGLARLYLRDQNYDGAAALLNTALSLPDAEISADTPAVEAELLTNLGWARLNQGWPLEAEENLRDSLALQDEWLTQGTDEQQQLRGTTYCLLAQATEVQTSVEAALPLWQDCLQTAEPTNPATDAWTGEARRRLER
ncbi:MAG: hypothetical protein AAF651_02370 [Cyanobacteria bacterium P01_C01_bin.73]